MVNMKSVLMALLLGAASITATPGDARPVVESSVSPADSTCLVPSSRVTELQVARAQIRMANAQESMSESLKVIGVATVVLAASSVAAFVMVLSN